MKLLLKKKIYSKLFKELKNNELLSFDQLIDITAIDYPSREKRFELIYIFLSMKKNKRIILKTSIKENDNIDSIIKFLKLLIGTRESVMIYLELNLIIILI